MANEYSTITKDFAEGNARESLRQRSVLEHGTNTGLPFVTRYVVLETIFDPSIIDATKLDYWTNDLGISNPQHATVAPRNSIIARRVQSNNTTTSEQPMIFYPFLPPTISLPCQPGEHVWVMFEDPTGTKNDLGYWMWRIVEPNFVEDVNHTHHHRSHDPSFVPGIKDVFEGTANPVYEFRNGSVGESDGERYTIAETSTIPEGGEKAYEELLTETDGSRLTHLESVPRYKKRPSETSFEGTNNTLIVLGRDRANKIAEYDDDPRRGKIPRVPDNDSVLDGAGSIDLVAGRGQTPATRGVVIKNSLDKNELAKSSQDLAPDEGDPDYANDRSRVLISQRTRVDVNFGMNTFNGELEVTDSEDGDGAIVVKSDKIRLFARSDIEFLVTGFERDSEGNMVSSEDTSRWASVIIKSDGSIVIRPSESGVIKLGSDSANKAILCTDLPATQNNGQVSATPLISTMGGQIGTQVAGQGTFSTKVLID